mgnify:CR=1 FL=1
MMSLTIGLAGMDPATETALKSAFAEANERLASRWRLLPEAEAALVVVDMDSMYGPMSWLRLHASGKRVIGLTSAPRAQTDYRLGRPFSAHSLGELLRGTAQDAGDVLAPADTAPGTVTAFQPFSGMPPSLSKYAGVQPAGARPDAFRPCSSLPSHTIAKPSLPMPQPVGSTTVKAMAAASAASTALPPASNMRRPACAARGCEVLTTLRPSTDERCDA